MPRDSSGTYTTPVNSVDPAVSGTTIVSADFNSLTADLTTEMTDSFDRSGKGAMLADLAMGGFKITNLGAPVATTDAARKSDLTLGGDVTGTLAVNVVSKIAGTTVTGTTGTGNVVLDTTPTISKPNLVGLNSGSFQAATYIGEILEGIGTSVAVTSAVSVSITSVALTKGNWYIFGQAQASTGAGVTISQSSCCISSVTNNFTVVKSARADILTPGGSNFSWFYAVGGCVVSISATTTYYLVMNNVYAGGNGSGSGRITGIRLG